MFSRFILAICALGVIAGCAGRMDRFASTPVPDYSGAVAPPGAPPGTCWGKKVTPAVVETVTEQVILQPAEVSATGAVIRPAIYKTETRQAIVKERQETWFETPCADVLTPEFTASLQRALQARGFYRGAITGTMDARTRMAVRRYQIPLGLNSDILSLSSARGLGLVALERDALES